MEKTINMLVDQNCNFISISYCKDGKRRPTWYDIEFIKNLANEGIFVSVRRTNVKKFIPFDKDYHVAEFNHGNVWIAVFKDETGFYEVSAKFD